MASSASGQYAANSVFWLATQAGKMERYCSPGIARFVPANKISLKFKRVHESFLSQNIFRDSKKIFCDLFVGMELETQKENSANIQPSWPRAWSIIYTYYSIWYGKIWYIKMCPCGMDCGTCKKA